MTDLQLKLMERADKTLSFGCIIKREHDDNRICLGQSGGYGYDLYQQFSIPVIKQNIKVGYFDGYYDDPNELSEEYSNIGHPYGFERLIYLYKSKEDKTIRQTFAYQDVYGYCENRPELYLKPCIDRPEQGQKLVLDFLQTLPNGTTTTNNK